MERQLVDTMVGFLVAPKVAIGESYTDKVTWYLHSRKGVQVTPKTVAEGTNLIIPVVTGILYRLVKEGRLQKVKPGTFVYREGK